VKCNKIFIYLFTPFFGNSATGQTRRRILTLDGSNDADSRKDEDVLFGVSLIMLLISWVKSPTQKNNFWVVNKRFQAEQIKY